MTKLSMCSKCSAALLIQRYYHYHQYLQVARNVFGKKPCCWYSNVFIFSAKSVNTIIWCRFSGVDVFKTSIHKLAIRQCIIFQQKGFQYRHGKHYDVRVSEVGCSLPLWIKGRTQTIIYEKSIWNSLDIFRNFCPFCNWLRKCQSPVLCDVWSKRVILNRSIY